MSLTALGAAHGDVAATEREYRPSSTMGGWINQIGMPKLADSGPHRAGIYILFIR